MRRRWQAVAAALALLLGSSSAPAEVPEDYRLALASIEREEWPEAARLLRQALAEEPRAAPGDRRKRVPYLPHYYLGSVLYRMHNCLSALDAWAESERQGVVRGTSHYSDLLRGRGECEALVLEPAIEQARKAVAATAEYARVADGLRGDPEIAEVWLDRPQLAASLTSSVERSATLPADLEAAISGRSLSGVLAVERAALELEETLSRDVDAALQQARKQVDDARSGDELEIRRLAVRATELVPRLAQHEARGDRALGRLRSELSQLVARQVELAPDAEVRELRALRQELSQAVAKAEGALAEAAARPPPRPEVPAPLLAAAKAHFRGDYEIAVEILERQSFDDPKAAAQGYLLRAAARFALYRLGGASDGALREAAAADVRACRSFDAGLEPEAGLFSPRFRRFFGAGAAG